MGKNQRELRNYFRAAKSATRYGLSFFVIGLVPFSVMLVYTAVLLRDVEVLVTTMPDPPLGALLQEKIVLLSILFFISFLVFIAVGISILIVKAQRFGGPMTAICSALDELIDGNYQPKRKLRVNDELIPIMEKVERLANQLKENAKKK